MISCFINTSPKEKFMLTFCSTHNSSIFVFYKVTQGDSEASEVIMSINDKVNTEALTPEQEKLKEQQMDETEGLEGRQLSEKRDMNSNLDEEMATEELAVDTQIQQQKRLVCTIKFQIFWTPTNLTLTL